MCFFHYWRSYLLWRSNVGSCSRIVVFRSHWKVWYWLGSLKMMLQHHWLTTLLINRIVILFWIVFAPSIWSLLHCWWINYWGLETLKFFKGALGLFIQRIACISHINWSIQPLLIHFLKWEKWFCLFDFLLYWTHSFEYLLFTQFIILLVFI